MGIMEKKMETHILWGYIGIIWGLARGGDAGCGCLQRGHHRLLRRLGPHADWSADAKAQIEALSYNMKVISQ